ncbi:hypothetical protein AMST5_00933 [freshwater sediment metagenome]|uniref:Uncharacterized protein n=1 Tax=freshwater sediment metagenome TaxID=556182 RepID=A0AA48LZZ4_9ZZZZ
MAKVGNFIIGIALLSSAASSALAAESKSYLNVSPSGTKVDSASPSASGPAPSLSNSNANNGRNGSSFCQQPIYDSWGNVTGYRQGGC